MFKRSLGTTNGNSSRRIRFAVLRSRSALAALLLAPAAILAPLWADSPQITSVSPDSGIPGTQVTIKANVSLAKITDVVFGGERGKTFTVQSDGSITAMVPATPFKSATSVPVTVILDKTMLPTNSKFTIPIGMANVTVPQPQATGGGPVQQPDPWWQAGNGRSVTLGPGSPCEGLCSSGNTILFSSLPVSFYVATSVGRSDLAGQLFNAGNFAIGVQMCDVSDAAVKQKTKGTSGPFTACKNWDGYDGVWIPIDNQCKQTSLPQFFVWTWTAQQTGNYLSVGSSGKVTADVSACFDDQDLARTFEYQFDASPATISKDKPTDQPGRSDTETSPSFNVVVAPSALLQVKAIPYTIIYQPPGDESTVSFTTADTYATQFSMMNSKTVTNKSTTSQSSSTNFAEDMAFVLGFTAGSNSQEKDTTEKDFGTVQGSGPQGMSSAAFSSEFSLPADAGLVPGNGVICDPSGSNICASTTQTPNLYAQEPFWDDVFVLIVKPQFAIWVVGGDADRYQMYGAVPALGQVSVGVLDACATGQTASFGVLNPCEITYSAADMTAGKSGNGVVSKGVSGTVTLTAAEARNLLALDPFYAGGQDANVDASRANQIASTSYGSSALGPGGAFGQTFTNTTQLQQNQNAQTTYTTDVSSMNGTSSSTGLTMKMSTGGGGGGGTSAGGDISLTVQSQDQVTNETDVQLNYQNSTAVSKEVVTTANVSLNDTANCSATVTTDCHGPLATRPSANIYFDRVFGSFMFQDPGAPKDYSRDKLPKCCIVLINSLLAQETMHPRFSDVPKGDPNVGAIGVLALTKVLPGNSDGTFKPNDPLTREDLAVAIAQAAHLPKAASIVKFTDIADNDANLSLIEAATAARAVTPRSAAEFGASDPVMRSDLTSALSTAGLSVPAAGGSTKSTEQLTRAEAAAEIFAAVRNR